MKLLLQHNLIPFDLSCLVVLAVVFFPYCKSPYAQNFSNAELLRKKKSQIIQKHNLLIAPLPFDLDDIVEE